jgi:succinate dehydrogenase assembly factor 2
VHTPAAVAAVPSMAVTAADMRMDSKDAATASLPEDVRMRKLIYRSRQRGWLELDLIIGSWAKENLATLSSVELDDFITSIIDAENPDLMNYLVEQKPVPAEVSTPMLQRLVTYAAEEKKQWVRGPTDGNQ